MTDLAASPAQHTPSTASPIDWRPEDAVAWLDGGGRFAQTTSELLDGISKALVQAGAPLIRTRFSFQTLHPLIRLITVKWWLGRGATHEIGAAHGLEAKPKFVGSPLEAVFTQNRVFRRKLEQLDPASDHRILFDIRDQGGTDYLAAPIRFAGPEKGMFAIVSDAPEGFTDAQIAGFEKLCERIAPVLEALIQRHIAETLLETYIGRRSGKQVLRGLVKRGDAEQITAAFWYSDFRDFTRLTETRPIIEVLDTVNRYFEIAWEAAKPRGGEVINLIGDALLMIFPVSGETSPDDACRAALETARAALKKAADDSRLRFGVGLHFGEAIYGNIGAPDRLDFTVMGAAVNRAARLESLTKEIGEPILASAAFMEHIDEAACAYGRHAVKGLAEPMEIFAPAAVKHEAPGA